MMRVFKGRWYAQKYDEFKYKEEVTIVGGKHNGTSAFVIGETPLKVHVCLPSGSTSTLFKSDVRGRKKLLADAETSQVEVSKTVDDEYSWATGRSTKKSFDFSLKTNVKTEVKGDIDLFKRGGLDGLETDTVCALRLLMVCFERQGINPTSSDAYKLFRDFAEEYYNAED